MKALIWIVGVLLLIGLGKFALIWSGAYNIAADEPHWRLTERVMDTLRDRSIAVRAARIDVPDLSNETLVRAGAGNYEAMCVECHLRPGVAKSELSAGLYPAPPPLARTHLDDPAAAFWVIKHGIKMSGMPAWGKSMDDGSIWGMVAFVRQLPDMSETQYHELVESSEGHTHGSGDDMEKEHAHVHVHEDETTHEH